MPTTITGSTGVSQVQDGVVDADALATLTKPLGVGQTWQNVTASRTAGVTYTNTTGRPIMVSLRSGYYGVEFTVDGVSRGGSSSNGAGSNYAGVTFVVPNNSTYSAIRASQAGNIDLWHELR
jgi:Flp pilus assembly protein TadG